MVVLLALAARMAVVVTGCVELICRYANRKERSSVGLVEKLVFGIVDWSSYLFFLLFERISSRWASCHSESSR
jgi:hypothetical protein